MQDKAWSSFKTLRNQEALPHDMEVNFHQPEWHFWGILTRKGKEENVFWWRHQGCHTTWSPIRVERHLLPFSPNILRGHWDTSWPPPKQGPALWIFGWAMSNSLLEIVFLHCCSFERPPACLSLDIISWSQPCLKALKLSSGSSISRRKTIVWTTSSELASNDLCKWWVELSRNRRQTEVQVSGWICVMCRYLQQDSEIVEAGKFLPKLGFLKFCRMGFQAAEH